MIEQVLGGGGGGGGCAAIFGSVFQSYCILCRFFSIHRCLFFGSILPIFAYFFCCIFIYVYFIKKSNSVLGTKFSFWFLYSWAHFLIIASIFLGSIFDTGYFIICSTVLNLSGTLPAFFMASYPRSRCPCITRNPKLFPCQPEN